MQEEKKKKRKRESSVLGKEREFGFRDYCGIEKNK